VTRSIGHYHRCMGERRSVSCPQCRSSLSVAAGSTAAKLRCSKCAAVFPSGQLTARTPPPPTPAGWYPDPNGAPTQRYFDGHVWTDQLAPAAPGDGLSVKSGAVAGLLQLFLGWLGLGRFYLGYTSIGGVQLALGIAGILGAMMCFVGLIILVPLSLWVCIEGIMMMAGAIPDSEGRKLR
jgi:TM2 domain-containing membrane protein YozV